VVAVRPDRAGACRDRMETLSLYAADSGRRFRIGLRLAGVLRG